MERGGEGKFFRRAIGLEAYIEEKDIASGKIEKKIDFEHRTELNFELEICSKFLGGMLHMDFLKLPREEKLKWKLYYIIEQKREEHFLQKQEEEMNKNRGIK